MSAVNMLISNLQSLSADDRSYVLAHFLVTPIVEAKSVETVVVSEEKKEKKGPRGGGPTAHGDYTKKVLEENKDQLAAYKTANPDKKGTHLSFVGEYKKAHTDEWNTFKAEWETKHPKVEKSAEAEVAVEVAPVTSDEVKPKKTRPPMTEDHKAKLKAGREKKAAEKKAAQGAASPARSVSPSSSVGSKVKSD